MKNVIKINGIVFVLMLSIPLIIEYITATAENPGTGFDVLLYEPFDFAYVVLTFIIFLTINIVTSKKLNMSMWKGAGISIGILIPWFVISFLSVAQLHISLGGKL